MKSYDEHTNEVLAGKTIKTAYVSGQDIMLEFTDGTRFHYDVDINVGGWAICWGIRDKDGNMI